MWQDKLLLRSAFRGKVEHKRWKIQPSQFPEKQLAMFQIGRLLIQQSWETWTHRARRHNGQVQSGHAA